MPGEALLVFARTPYEFSHSVQNNLTGGDLLDHTNPTAHLNDKSKIHRDARLTSAQWWEVYHRLKLKHLQKGWEREFYNSVEAYGPDKPISINGAAHANNVLYVPYDAEREGIFSIDFDLEEGEYELLFDAEAAFHHDSAGYQGWHKTTMWFALNGLSIERVF